MMDWVTVNIVRLQGQERIQDIFEKTVEDSGSNFIKKGRKYSDIIYNVLKFSNSDQKSFLFDYLKSA